MIRAIYNRQGWILCQCAACNRLNYVEPHGTTAQCACSPDETEHTSIPYDRRDASGTRVDTRGLPKPRKVVRS